MGTDLELSRHPRQAVTPQRKALFLEQLRKTGSVCAASAAAYPWSSTAKRPGYGAFQTLIKRDPEFAAQVEEAKRHALAKVEKVIFDHSTEGVQRPIYQMGRLVGYETVFDHKLLLAQAQRLDPSAWTQRTQATVEGHITHGVLVVNAPAQSTQAWIEAESKVVEAGDSESSGSGDVTPTPECSSEQKPTP